MGFLVVRQYPSSDGNVVTAPVGFVPDMATAIAFNEANTKPTHSGFLALDKQIADTTGLPQFDASRVVASKFIEKGKTFYSVKNVSTKIYSCFSTPLIPDETRWIFLNRDFFKQAFNIIENIADFEFYDRHGVKVSNDDAKKYLIFVESLVSFNPVNEMEDKVRWNVRVGSEVLWAIRCFFCEMEGTAEQFAQISIQLSSGVTLLQMGQLTEVLQYVIPQLSPNVIPQPIIDFTRNCILSGRVAYL